MKCPRDNNLICASGSVGGVRPCQGRGRGFESRLALSEYGFRVIRDPLFVCVNEITESFYLKTPRGCNLWGFLFSYMEILTFLIGLASYSIFAMLSICLECI